MRPMFVWRAANGAIVADIVQKIKPSPRGPQTVYVARVQGEQVEKSRFACARRAVETWLQKNRIVASPSST